MFIYYILKVPLDGFLVFKKKSTPPSVDAMLLVNAFELMPKVSFDYKLGFLVIAGA